MFPRRQSKPIGDSRERVWRSRALRCAILRDIYTAEHIMETTAHTMCRAVSLESCRKGRGKRVRDLKGRRREQQTVDLSALPAISRTMKTSDRMSFLPSSCCCFKVQRNLGMVAAAGYCGKHNEANVRQVSCPSSSSLLSSLQTRFSSNLRQHFSLQSTLV